MAFNQFQRPFDSGTTKLGTGPFTAFNNVKIGKLPTSAPAEPQYENKTNVSQKVDLRLTNITGTPQTYSLWVVGAGGDPEDEDLIAFNVPLTNNEFMAGVLSLVLNEGDQLFLAAGASDSVTAFLCVERFC